MWHYTDDHFDTESPNDDCNILVNTAISKCDNVVISSICPRLDDTHGNIAKGNTTLMMNTVYFSITRSLSNFKIAVAGIRINISITTCFRILLINLNVYIIYMCFIIMCNIELINKICL
jgi:hypothetical protein